MKTWSIDKVICKDNLSWKYKLKFALETSCRPLFNISKQSKI